MSTVTCEVEPSYAATAGDERALLGGKVSMPHEQRPLVFPVHGNGKGQRLGDGRQGVGSFAKNRYDNWLPRRRTSVGAGVQVFVRTPAGRSLALDVDASETVAEVRAKIQAREHLAGGHQNWRLVFAGRHLDDGGRTLADYGVGKDANLHLLLRLRGGAGDDDTAVEATGGPHGGTAIGLLATVVAFAAAFSCFPAAAGSGSQGAALLLFLFALAVTGVNLITAGLCQTSTAAAYTLFFAAPSVLGKTAAFVRRNIAVLAVSAASLAVTGAVVNDARPVLCFGFFALFLVTVSLVTIGLAN